MLEIVRESLDVEFEGKGLAAHVNWYEGGEASLAPHSDKDDVFVPRSPIFSFTLSRGKARGFQIYKKDASNGRATLPPLYDLELEDGDMLIMAGNMQRDYMHGVKKTTRKDYRDSRRINVTVRVRGDT
jgi:alkylated DNA repair dioxygenase AlkB